jgi:serine/threonine protein kinase
MGETVLFDRYRLVAPAGSGGSAQVWRAVDAETGDVVAVKRLHPIVFADASARQRLEREFHALRGLDAPHVVKVRDLHVSDDEAALVLDYVDGKSVAERLAAGPPLSVDETLSIVDDVAEALTAAHGAGIVHRDVTPGNILLDPTDGARLTDFGIALGADATAVTATGQLMGTLRYVAPEQLRGERATPASDLHALAAVAYELLAGRPAYAASTPVGLAEAHAAGPEPIANLPPSVDAAVRRGLAADPSARPADVRQFAAELRGALQGAQTLPIAVVAPAVAPARGPMWSPDEVEPLPADAPAVRGVAPPASPRQRPAALRRIAGPVVAVLALLLAGAVLAALGPAADRDAPAAGNEGATDPPLATLAPSPPTTDPPSTDDDDKPDKGKGNGGDGNGKGKGNDGNGSDKDD